MNLVRSELIDQLHCDLRTIEIGPVHSTLPGNMLLKLELDGEMIVRALHETGFSYKALEKKIIDKKWNQALLYAGHVDPEATSFGELVYCLCIEKVLGVEIQDRARRVRTIVSEWVRVFSHLKATSILARTTGLNQLEQYIRLDREKVMDLLEVLTGARFTHLYFRPGGLAADVTEGFLDRATKLCGYLNQRFQEYELIYFSSPMFQDLLMGCGPLSHQKIIEYGITGPVLRSSLKNGTSDCFNRFETRWSEIKQSLIRIQDEVEKVNPGPFKDHSLEGLRKVPAGEAYVQIEAPRGILGCYLFSTGSETPKQVLFKTPSVALLSIIPELLKGTKLEELPVILASMDISIAEADL